MRHAGRFLTEADGALSTVRHYRRIVVGRH